MYKINHANIKEWAANYDGEPFDAILCDPPYELGFMGKSWDSSGIAFDTEMWADIYKLLKPGGHLLAFSGSRTYHRMAVAIEDAGFEIRDQLIWMYGSGFPKSLNIGKAVDKIQGNEREVINEGRVKGVAGSFTAMNPSEKGFNSAGFKWGFQDKGTSEWEGYGTALKPAHEPCVLARKPIDKGMTVAGNVLKHGTGGLNIDGCRVATSDSYNDTSTNTKKPSLYEDGLKNRVPANLTNGRFPANLIHDGSDEVEAVFPQTKPSKQSSTSDNRKTSFYGVGGVAGERNPLNSHNDSGSASRYFYTAKASKSERNAGLEGFEERKSSKMGDGIRSNVGNGTPGNTESADRKAANHHPTVKPLSLTKYLATLIKPPTGGRLLVPFSGSGSEMIGALQAGWEYVEGVELTEEYIPIAEARIKYWLEQHEIELSKPRQVSLV